jgi:O-antigen/teichoic acid export membrane protein
MRKLLRATGWMTLAQGISTLLRVLNGKVAALILGPEGIGILAQLYQIKTLIIQYGSLGLGNGIVKHTASGIANEQYSFVQRLIATTVTIVTIPSLVVVLGSYLFGHRLSWMVFGREDLYLVLFAFVPTLPLVVVGGVFNNVLAGMKEIRRLALALIIISASACGLTIILVLNLELWGAVVAASIENIIFFGIYLWFLRRSNLAGRIFPSSIVHIDKRVLRILLKFGLTTLFVGNVGSLSTLFVRSLVVHRFGVEANGIYQAALVTTTQSISMLLTAMSTYTFPRISELGQDYTTIIVEKNNALRLVLLLGTPILSTLLVLKEWIIPLLTSSEFLPATELLPFQVIGVFFLLVSWGIGIGLLAMERFVAFSALHLVRYIGHPLLFLILHSRYGLWSISFAFAITEGLVALLQYIYHRRTIDFHLSPRNSWLIIAAAALVGITAYTSSASRPLLRYLVPAGLVLVWLLSTTRSEQKQIVERLRRQ